MKCLLRTARLRPVAVLLSLLLSVAFSVRAQMPVSVTPQLLPPYSLKLSDYYLGADARLMLTVLNNDFDLPGIRVKLRMTLTGRTTGITLRTRNEGVLPPLVLDAGTPVQLSGPDLQPFFNPDNLEWNGITRTAYERAGVLPEDVYDFCFQAYEVGTGRTLSRATCATAFISLSDPPLLNIPFRASVIPLTEPTNIPFSWTPRHRVGANSTASTEYIFQLVEMWDAGANPQSAFDSRPPLYETRTTATSLLYGPTEPLLLPGKAYAWRVRASTGTSIGDQNTFRNGGVSEVYFFTVVPNCPALSNVVALPAGNTLGLQWPARAGVNEYRIEYREAGNAAAPWTAHTVYSPLFSIPNLTLAKTYEYRVGYPCDNSGVFTYSPIGIATLESGQAIRGNVRWAFSQDAEDELSNKQGYDLATLYPESESQTSTPEGPIGRERYPLQNAVVKLDFYEGGSFLQSSTVRTDANGNYEVQLPTALLPAARRGRLSVSVTAGMPGHSRGATIQRGISGFEGNYKVAELQLQMNTFDFYPQLKVTAGTPVTDLKLDVFIPEFALGSVSWIKNAGMAAESGSITYNGVRYLPMASRLCKPNDASTPGGTGQPIRKLPKLPAGNYLVRITQGSAQTYAGLETDFPPQTAVEWWQANGSNKVITLRRTYWGGAVKRLSGTVTYNDRNVQPGVTVTVKTTNTLTGVVNEYTDETDNAGKYEIYVPQLEAKGTYTYTVRDAHNALNNSNAPALIVSQSGGDHRQDFNFQFSLNTLVGRVVNQDGRPIAGARVAVQATDGSATYAQMLTTTEGFYALQVPVNSRKVQVVVSVNGYAPITREVNLSDNNGRALTANEWANRINNRAVVSNYLRLAGQSTATAEMLGLGSGSLQAVFPTLLGAPYQMRDVGEIGITTVQIGQGTARIKVVFSGGTGQARLTLSDGSTATLSHNETFTKKLDAGDYSLSLQPLAGGLLFAPVSGNVSIRANDTARMTIDLAPTVLATGIVRGANGQRLAKATVSVVGKPYTTTANDSGVYQLPIPANTEFTLRAAATGYDSRDSGFLINRAVATIDFTLQPRSSAIPAFATFSGYPVTIDKAVADPNNDTLFVLTGSIHLPDNGTFQFDTTTGENKLSFTNVAVTAGSSDNAVPTGEVAFTETVLHVICYGVAPVEVSDSTGIKLVRLKTSVTDSSFAAGGIVGEKMMLRIADKSAKLGLGLRDAELRIDAEEGRLPDTATYNAQTGKGKNMQAAPSTMDGKMLTQSAGPRRYFIFSPETAPINELATWNTYKIHFSGEEAVTTQVTNFKRDTTKQDKEGYLKMKIAGLLPFYVAKDSSILDSYGILLKGFVKVPNLPGISKLTDSGVVRIQKLLITPGFKMGEFTFALSKAKPLNLAIQRIQGTLTSLSLYNLGTPNFGMGFGGYITTKKPVAGKPSDTLFIRQFAIINKEDGLTIDAKLAVGKTGIGVKGLRFLTPEDAEIAMSFNTAKKSFLIKGTGRLEYKKPEQQTTNLPGAPPPPADTAVEDTSKAGSVGKLLAIDISYFQFNTADWSFFMAAKNNVELDLKVAKVAVDKLVVSVGSDVSMTLMQKYLSQDSVKFDREDALAPDQIMEESLASWAVGVRGHLGFGVRGLNVGISASVLIGITKNEPLDIRLDTIGMHLENPAFLLDSKLLLLWSGPKIGVYGAAKLEALTVGLDASFKFFYLRKTATTPAGIEMGAEVKASLGPSGLPTGPITWYAIGGGFAFNTVEQTFLVKFLGDVGVTGTSKASAYLRNGFVQIFFDLKQCKGAPVLTGGGTLNLATKDMITVGFKLDFCKYLMLATVKGQLPEFVPKVTVNVNGVLYGMSPTKSRSGALFMGVNASVSALDNMLTGNGFIGLGVNYDNNHELSPLEVKAMWPSVDAGVKDAGGTRFNGMNINAALTFQRAGNVGISIKSFDLASISYNLYASGKGRIWWRFADNNFFAGIGVNLNASADATILGIYLGGSAYANLNASGGYDGSWFAKGDAGLGVQLYNNRSTSCNSISSHWEEDYCWNWKGLCGGSCHGWTCDPIYKCDKRSCMYKLVLDFKACFSLAMSFDYRQGQTFKTSFSTKTN